MLKILQRSSLSIGRYLLLTGLALGIVLLALYFAMRYWVLPNIEDYHEQVSTLASRALGLQVKIGKIEADLTWLQPHLRFANIQLLDEDGHVALELRRVDNIVSWTTLLSGELRLRKLEVDDPDLLVRRDKQGVLHVAGLQVSGHSSDEKLSDWLLHQSRVILNNGRVIWQDDMFDRPPLVFNQVQFRLDNSRSHHRFAVRVAPPSTLAAPLDARGDLVGESFSDLSGWRGELFTQISQADLGTWGTWINLPEEFSHAKGGLRAWLGLERGRINRITADLDMSEVRSRLAADLPQLNLSGLYGRIGWHELEHGFEVSTTKLALQMSSGFKLQPTDFHLRLGGAKENPFSVGEIQANAIELGDLSMLADYIPLGKAVRQKLTDFSPHGHIADLRAQWMGGGRFQVDAHFNNMSMQRVGKLPGVDGLSGQISGSDSSGNLTLNAPNIKLDAPQFLLGPITFDTFSLHAGWQHKQNDWDIKLSDFSASNEDVTGTAHGNYLTDEKSLGVLDLSLDVTHASLSRIVKYLPKELMGKSTMNWLQESLLGGESNDAHLRLRGDLNDFPFPKNKKGLFQVDAKAQNVIVDYEKAWPRAENGQGTLHIEGEQLQVNASSVTIDGNKVQKASVTIPDITTRDAVVKIQGEGSVATQRALEFIKHSPIRGYTGGFTDNTKAIGEGRVEVKLDIPLGSKPIQLNGIYHFDQNEIDLDEYIPLAKNVSGDLKFTESSIQAKSIRAQIFGGPATISAQTEASGEIKAKLQGKINAEAWRQFDPAFWVQSLSGGTEWSTDVSVKDKQIVVVASSSLQGLASNLPEPLTKRSREVIPLKFEYKSAGASQAVMNVQVGDVVGLHLVQVENKQGARPFKHGYVDFGPARHIADKEGIWITGTVPVFSVEGWFNVYRRNNNKGGAFPVIDGADVTVQKLVGYGTTIDGVSIRGRNHESTVSTQFAAKDLNGEVTWFPAGHGKFIARFKNAIFDNDEKNKKNEVVHAALNKANEPDNKNLSMPVIDLAVEHFTYQGKQLGLLELHASQVEKDVLLDHLRVSNPDGVLLINGKWGLMQSQTHVATKLELYDTGKMLNRSGFPNTLKDGKGTVEGDLIWPGAPFEVALANLEGHLNFKMSKGQFLKVDPGAGKLLSVLNLQSLPKRIALDFTDVFSQGFEFDNIEGVAQLRQGVIMSNDFKINGSAAQVTLTGQVDLNRETQSLRVRVMPAIGNSVSLLAFAAGPAVGAGVFLANKLFRNPLDKLVSFEYNVTGGWADPKVEKVGQVKTVPKNSDN